MDIAHRHVLAPLKATSTATRRRDDSRLESIAVAVSTLIAAAGCVVVLGWAFDADALKRIVPGLPVTRANTGLCTALIAAAIWLVASNDPVGGPASPEASGTRSRRRGLGLALAGVVAAIAFVSLLEHVIGRNLGVDELLFDDPRTVPHPGRMAPSTALAFLLLAAALVCSRPQTGPMRLIFSDTAGGRAVRVLSPAAVALPIALGALRPVGEGVGTWLLTSLIVTLLVTMTWALATSLDRAEIAARHADEALDALAEELNQARRLESVGLLAGGIAHDFNNLLGVIINYAKFVADTLPEEGQAREDIEEIRAAAQRGADLTRQLLIFSRREVVKSEVIDLNDVVSGLENLLRRALGERVALETRFSDELWPVEADPGQLEQVLVNLAVNARDAMPDGGRLIVETANTMVDESFAADHVNVQPGRYVRLTVSDFGVGMDEEIRQRAFEPFFTTKSKAEGTGLGLATVYGIVTQAGGRIDLYSERGIGTTIKVHLPASESVPSPAEADVIAHAPRGRGETILVVEDQPEVRRVAERILSQAGYEVLGAADGADGVALAASNEVDLLMTDLIMPGMLGTELVDRMRGERPDLNVVFMSGYSHAMLEHGTLPDNPHAAFIEKPFTADQLQHVVRGVLDASEANH